MIANPAHRAESAVIANPAHRAESAVIADPAPSAVPETATAAAPDRGARAAPRGRTFTVSARGKAPGTPILPFLGEEFGHLGWEAIESVFGFVEPCTMYGGRPYSQPELSPRDVVALAEAGIGLRLPLSNHAVERDEYERYRDFLAKYERPGNSVIVHRDDLAQWIRADFPGYQIEASVIKEVDSHEKLRAALAIYDTVVLPMRLNEDLEFLGAIEEKERITLFANAGCALTCPAKICYGSFSRVNKGNGDRTLCSFDLKPRELLGVIDFDLERLARLGFSRFKMLRTRRHGLTGY